MCGSCRFKTPHEHGSVSHSGARSFAFSLAPLCYTESGDCMNDSEIIGQVHNSMYQQLKKSGAAAPVQVLMDLGVLAEKDHDNWRHGRVDYLERVCKVNLHKLAFIMKQVRAYAKKQNLKPSWTYYKQWGRKGKPAMKLRFSKSGDEGIERQYATHYISPRLAGKKKQDAETEAGTDNGTDHV